MTKVLTFNGARECAQLSAVPIRGEILVGAEQATKKLSRERESCGLVCLCEDEVGEWEAEMRK